MKIAKFELPPSHPDNQNSRQNRQMATNSDTMPGIGVIGGSGPDAGVNVVQQILALNRERMGSAYKSDKDAPEIVLFQQPGIGGPHGSWDLEDKTTKEFAKLWKSMTDTIRKLHLIEVDSFCLTCNTLHVLEEDIRKWMHENAIKPSFVSIITATRLKILESGNNLPGNKRVTVLGTLLTTDLQKSPYARLGACKGMDILGIEDSIRQRLQTMIIEVKRCGPAKLELRAEAWSIISNVLLSAAMIDQPFAADPNDVEATRKTVKALGDEYANNLTLVLACTELPLLFSVEQSAYLRDDLRVNIIDPNVALSERLLINIEMTMENTTTATGWDLGDDINGSDDDACSPRALHSDFPSLDVIAEESTTTISSANSSPAASRQMPHMRLLETEARQASETLLKEKA